jgi:hypothetical protein
LWNREGEAGEAPAEPVDRRIFSGFAARQEPRRLALPFIHNFGGEPIFFSLTSSAPSAGSRLMPASSADFSSEA